LLGLAAGMAVVGVIGYYGAFSAWTGSSRADRPLTSVVRRATLRITVSERGNLESCVTVDGICEVNTITNQIKIISLVPEGNKVKKGEIVCKFDSSEIDKNISQQDIKVKQAVSKIETTQQEMEIQRNKGEGDTIAAKVEKALAELDLEITPPRPPSKKDKSASRKRISRRRRTSSKITGSL
jgi:HlyD family secretion protein